MLFGAADANTQRMGLVLAFAVVGLPLAALPTIVAARRRHRNLMAVGVLNLVVVVPFGINLTLYAIDAPVVGLSPAGNFAMSGVWLAALVWALVAEQGGPRYGRRDPHDDTPNPFAAPAAVPVVVPPPAVVGYACPHCKGRVRVPVAMMGSAVACGRCRGTFTATPTAEPDGD